MLDGLTHGQNIAQKDSMCRDQNSRRPI